MQLIFLDRLTLKYKDNAFVDKNFEINLDLVISQKSSFVVNKTNILTDVGDIVVFKESSYFYIGLIETIELTNNYMTTIKTLDFKEIFNVEVLVTSHSGDLASYLERVITQTFITNSDKQQALPYLQIEKLTTRMGTLSFEKDKLMSIKDLFELISKTYGVSVISEVVFLRGRITGIIIKIGEVSSGIKLRNNVSAITDLVINDSSNQLTSKVVYYPKEDNKTYKEAICFYLLKNGEITQDENNSSRMTSLNTKASTYSDEDYSTLYDKARSEMQNSKLDHNITFNLKTENYILVPFVNLHLGDFIEFFVGGKTYDSVVTGIKFKDTFKVASITLGEYRIKLTEKVQLLNKSVNSAVGDISIIRGGITDLDGGEY